MSPQPFPHLKPAETVLWSAFLRGPGRDWDRFDYDVRVGQSHPTSPDQPDYIRRMIAKISPLRIDAVGFRGRQPTIFEVTPTGHRTLIGALLLYRHLYSELYPSSPPAGIAGVVGTIRPDVERYLATQGAAIYKFPGLLPF